MHTVKPSIYLAAQFARRDELKHYAAALTAIGFKVTSRWLKQATPLNGRMDNHSEADNLKFARQDLEDIRRADSMLFFAEDPLVGIPRGGRHVEFGIAIEHGMPIYVVGSRENVFHWMLSDTYFFSDFAQFLKCMKEERHA